MQIKGQFWPLPVCTMSFQGLVWVCMGDDGLAVYGTKAGGQSSYCELTGNPHAPSAELWLLPHPGLVPMCLLVHSLLLSSTVTLHSRLSKLFIPPWGFTIFYFILYNVHGNFWIFRLLNTGHGEPKGSTSSVILDISLENGSCEMNSMALILKDHLGTFLIKWDLGFTSGTHIYILREWEILRDLASLLRNPLTRWFNR